MNGGASRVSENSTRCRLAEGMAERNFVTVRLDSSIRASMGTDSR